LSYPALYTHIKTKHNSNGTSSGRGRGRPKKDTGDPMNSIKMLYNPATADFFKHPERMGETSNLMASMTEVFREIYDLKHLDRNKLKKIKHYENLGVHPFFRKIQEMAHSPKVLDGENSKCDEIFADYIIKVSKCARKEFFEKVLKFVVLFRESLNIMNSDKVGNEEKDYTELYNAEDAPDISNEFVTEFLDTETALFGFQKDEAIDLTQNFCQWLYDNNFTCSKLSLISGF
jgi:hypothetical protein